ncbi:hypothetical protein ABID65_006669 [Bradyrhizobium sp. S3.9.2]
MSDDRFNGDETNVEGIACQMASNFPFEDAEACEEILEVLPTLVRASIASRAKRHAKRGQESEK